MRRPVAVAALATIGLATAAAAAWVPLWVYALSLALFGLPHVLTELRYVDGRFAARTPPAMRRSFVVLLLAVAALRAAAIGDLGTAAVRGPLELAAGAGLVATTVLISTGGARWLGALLAATLAWGAATTPAVTLVVLSLLHNLTPIGFLAERLRGPARRRALLLCVVGFVLVPAGMVTLLPLPQPCDGPLGTGDLDQHLAVFVPRPWLGGEFADRLFAVAAWWQCLHYAIVLHVLPRLGRADHPSATMLPWPRPRAFAAVVVLLGAAMTTAFVAGFGTARASYGVFAAVHAWLELPVLVLACGAMRRGSDGADVEASRPAVAR